MLLSTPSALVATVILMESADAAGAQQLVQAVPLDELRPDSNVLKNPGFDLLTLEIQEARGGGRQPLEATVQILDVVRGRMEVGETATAAWDWDDFRGRKSFQRPQAGTRFLAAVISSKSREGKHKLSIVRTFAATEDNLEIARRYMAQPPRLPWPVFALPLIGWVFVLLASRRVSAWPRALLAVGALASGLATLWVYYDYERHMSPYYTIRLDLLLVGPAVLASLAIPLGVWWLVYRRRHGGGDGG